MINNSLQGDLQEAIRNALNCANSYEGDLYALCNLYGVADGAVSGRLIPVAQKHSPTIGTASGALNYLLQNPTVLPSLGLNFVDGTDRLDSRVTFTRASNAWRFNSAGVLTQATTNTPRFDYNPSTLAPRGLLIEEQRVNSIRNNTMVGAVAGTPGTLPTNWSVTFNTTTGITRSVEGVGVEDGINYVDIRLVGTASGAGSVDFVFELTNAIAAATGQTWGASVYWKLQAGSFTGLSGQRFYAYEYNSSSGFVNAPNAGTPANPTSAALRTQRFTGAVTLSGGATTAFVRPLLKVDIANGAAIDITLRIGLPQLEQGAFATSVIPTSGAAATRAADVAEMTGSNFSSWYNQTEGTLFAEGLTNRPYSGSLGGQLFGVANTSADRIFIGQGTTTSAGYAQVDASGANQAALSIGGVLSNGTTTKTAVAYKANDFAGSINSSAVSTDTSGTVPSVTSALVGGSITGSAAGNWNGYIRRIAYYPRRLSNSELQAITS